MPQQQPLTSDEALMLAKYDRIRVCKAAGKQSRLALVLSKPSIVGRWTVVDYAYVVADRSADGRRDETISQHNHLAVIGQDKVWRA